ncbi:nucleotide kinase domain-containing protein [Jiangella asiatica]|uniref:nucleotide kinase domain-containing protein n=1 Tax=Jiangella asiatica TaxID=2530372 RepID=UPI0013A5DDDC|nr:nucleotide kinase domain-containing protein [Jiangella asiatica]
MLTVERDMLPAEQPIPAAGRARGPGSITEVTVAGRTLRPTEVFDTYWTFAARRQQIYTARLRGDAGPWTEDPILRNHRFTNCFRASDRVSQYLLANVIYDGIQDFDEVVFRTLLFKLFNKIETWELLLAEVGETPTWKSFDLDEYDAVLTRNFASGRRLYSAAYVMAPPKLGAERKHTNHLRLLRDIMEADVPAALQSAPTMQRAFELLRALPGLGDFLAFQYVIDLNYSEGLDFDEMDFVVAGPGAKDGIRKCFGPGAAGIESDIIAYMAESQDEHFERLELRFDGLFGRPLQLIDCQNLFCEVDKYARVAHPAVAGLSGRSRIKQRFVPAGSILTNWFPPKWGINVPTPATV